MNVTASSGLTIPNYNNEILDIVFTKNAILLNNFWNNDVAPISLIGFEYQIPESLPLLEYKYSEYPFLNKNVIQSCLKKEQTQFSLVGINSIVRLFDYMGSTSVAVLMGYNEAVLKLLDKHVLSGKTFTIMTSWGVIKPCILERVVGKKLGSQDIGGQCLEFQFKTAKINSNKTEKLISDNLKKLGI